MTRRTPTLESRDIGRPSRGGRCGLFVIIALTMVVGLVAVALYQRHKLEEMPVVHIPTPVMPNPNGFDFVLDAGEMVDNDEINIEIATAPQHFKRFPYVHPYSLAGKESLLKRNADALKELRAGLHYRFQAPPIRSFLAIPPPDGREVRAGYGARTLSRLLVLESRVRSAHGDWNGALGSGLDTIELGEKYRRGNLLSGFLITSFECETNGYQSAWTAVPHLTVAQAHAAIRRLQVMQDMHVPLASVMEEEKWAAMAGTLEAMRAPDWRRLLAQPISGSTDLRTASVSKRAVMDRVTARWDRVIAWTREPYATTDPSPSPADMPLWVLPTLELMRYQEAFMQTQSALLQTALALHAYKLDHGAYPKALTNLSPAYLPALMRDPFALRAELQYRPAGTTYVLYSIGPDGKDDGGAATNAAHVTNAPAVRHMRSKGDIVVGINK
jgi:hypothetical protein